MSGTSLDGLDISYVKFTQEHGKWRFESLLNETVDYSEEWRLNLAEAILLKESELDKFHTEYGRFLAQECKRFIEENQLIGKVDLIASHGHTVFHDPSKGITVQIGAADKIVEACNVLVINDFRIRDVQLGGQGAPLVPVGDRLLFGDYQACLNLGGIANISYESNGARIAFDIAPANLPLNKLMREKFNIEYDASGNRAKTGVEIPALIEALDGLDFYKKAPPKSLGIEWLNHYFNRIVDRFISNDFPIADILRSIVVHETDQIGKIINQNKLETILVTGGGAFNEFFIAQLKEKTQADIILPSAEIISFKEAIIFAFLGVLNFNDQVNTYKSVTGASADSIGGYRTYPPMV